ncbi:MAG: protein-disulfide reductase DsbD family protein [Verrucomicrobiota bacterium]|nr:protein-disulfide reductase DsbD family protein [Verrucomicrobiota bacterium]
MRSIPTLTRLVVLTLGCLLFASTALHAGGPVRDKQVEAELVSTVATFVPGQPFTVALRLKHDAHWHTYWKSSATGYATNLTWELPEGFTAGPIQWPVPVIHKLDTIIDFVFEDEVLLPVTITPAASLSKDKGKTYTLKAKAEWLMCDKVCVPGGAELSLDVSSGATEQPHPTWAAPVASALAQLPKAVAGYRTEAVLKDKAITLTVTGPTAFTSADGIYFFSDNGLIAPEEKQTVAVNAAGALVLKFTVADDATLPISEITGVLKSSAGFGATHLPGIEIKAATGVVNVALPPAKSLLAILGLAFVGGLILNLMPCVFPVLGIKITGFVNQAGEERSKIVMHGLAFTTGVLLSFWTLVGVLLVLKAAGDKVGWGYQMQNPGFVFLMAVFFLLFGLNMSGLFEIGQSAVGVGSGLQSKSGLGGSFFSGILATIVATPCSAPFLGTALGAAFTRSIPEIFIIFTFIGIGLSSPYLTLSAFPSLIKYLPRPGAWMETFKQSMSFLLYGTVAYLAWVLAAQLSDDRVYGNFGLLKPLLAMVLVAMAAWIYGRWTAYHLPTSTKAKGMIAAGAVLLLALYMGFPKADAEAVKRINEAPVGATGTAGLRPAFTADSTTINWEHWEPGLAETLAAEGHIVYVDFTARWCATCQANKAAVFSSSKIQKAFSDRKIIALKGDWTSQDPRITAALAKFEKAAVPLNLIYAPGKAQPIILPEALTPGIVLDALDGL